MSRDPKYVDMAVEVANGHGVVPWEFLGGMLAEGFDPTASRPIDPKDWQKYWDPPEPRFDVSFGFGQKNARYSKEYQAWCEAHGINYYGEEADKYPGDDVIRMIRDVYVNNPRYAMGVAADGYKCYRYDPEIEPLHAWVAYNGPVYYRKLDWRTSPNLDNYARGLAEAKEILGVTDVATPPVLHYDPKTPRLLQISSFTCSIRTTQWMLASLGINVAADVLYDRMVPELVTPEDGLLNRNGYGEGVERVLKEYLPATYHPRVKRFETLTWPQALSMAGRGPLGLGGRGWAHWSPASDLSPNGLVIANTVSGGWGGVLTNMTEADWVRLGPFGAVWVDMQDTAVPAPAAPSETDSLRAEIARLKDEIASKNTVIGYLTVDVANALQAAVNTLVQHRQ